MVAYLPVTVVLPARNEAGTLAATTRRVHYFCRRHLADREWSILLAVNGSQDGTDFIASLLQRRLSRVSSLVIERPGRGRALRRAALQIESGILCYMDVDLSTDLRHLPALLAAVEDGADVAVGSRHLQGSRVVRRPLRAGLSLGYNSLLRLVLGVSSFSDAQCGFKAFRVNALKRLLRVVSHPNWFFDTEVLVTAEALGMRIVEIPVDWVEGPRSSVNIPATIKENLLGIATLYMRRHSRIKGTSQVQKQLRV